MAKQPGSEHTCYFKQATVDSLVRDLEATSRIYARKAQVMRGKLAKGYRTTEPCSKDRSISEIRYPEEYMDDTIAGYQFSWHLDDEDVPLTPVEAAFDACNSALHESYGKETSCKSALRDSREQTNVLRAKLKDVYRKENALTLESADRWQQFENYKDGSRAVGFGLGALILGVVVYRNLGRIRNFFRDL